MCGAVDNFDDIFVLDNAVENPESIFSDDFDVDSVDICLLRAVGITSDELNRCINPCHETESAGRTAFVEVLMD